MKKITTSAKIRKTFGNVVVHILLSLLAVIWLIPIFWVILLSLRGEGQYITKIIPDSISFDNYRKLFTDTGVLDFPQMFGNTLVIAIFTCIISTFIVLSVSYCMSRMRFKMRRPLMNVALILGMFPGFMSMIAVYYILKALNMSEGGLIRVALILIYSAGSGLTFYIAKGFFDTIPKTIDEAAFIDGATRWQVFTKITIPLSKPIIVYTVLQSFMTPWLDFIFAKVICRASAKYYTVAIGLWNMLEKEYIAKWYNAFAAGAVCISIPIATLFLVMQRFYRESVSGAVKG